MTSDISSVEHERAMVIAYLRARAEDLRKHSRGAAPIKGDTWAAEQLERAAGGIRNGHHCGVFVPPTELVARLAALTDKWLCQAVNTDDDQERERLCVKVAEVRELLPETARYDNG